jgi:hypothetical protein
MFLLMACSTPPVRRDDRLPGGGDGGARGPRLSQAAAVDLAETFVAENGYTDLPPTKRGAALSRESVDDSDPEARLRARANTLKRKACGVMAEGTGRSEDGWTVVFCYNQERLRGDVELINLTTNRGRAVVMAPDGSDMRVLHVEIVLDAPGLRRLN